MKQSEALEKLCPMLLQNCLGQRCMGWTPEINLVLNPEFVPVSKRRMDTPYPQPKWLEEPFDPPQGGCGMKPDILVECGN
jgi:hypothetical protein